MTGTRIATPSAMPATIKNFLRRLMRFWDFYPIISQICPKAKEKSGERLAKEITQLPGKAA
jgi:hypothetical protein